MTSTRGIVYLVPNTLDLGTPDASTDLQETLPLGVIRRAARLGHWIAENAKSTRAFLKRVDAVVPLALRCRRSRSSSCRDRERVQWPRPNPGWSRSLRRRSKATTSASSRRPAFPRWRIPGPPSSPRPTHSGSRSCPCPAPAPCCWRSPAAGSTVRALPSSATCRPSTRRAAARIRELEALSRRSSQTQLVIETPYRNAALLSALLDFLQPSDAACRQQRSHPG